MLDFGKYLESVLYLFEYLVLYYVFTQIFEHRVKLHYFNFLFIFMLIGVNMYIDLFMGLISGPAIFIKLLLILIVVRCMFKGKTIHITLMAIICFIAMGISDVLVILTASTLFGQENFEFVNLAYNRLALGLTSKVLFLILGHIIISKFKNVNAMDPRNLYRIILILLIDTAFIVLSGDIYFQNKSSFAGDIEFMIAILLGVIMISLIVVRITENIASYAIKERDWQLREEEYRRQIFYLDHLEGINHQMKAIRHDFNHHIGCLQGMLEHGDVGSARDYTRELVNEAEKFNVAFSTTHHGISGLLSSKFQMMKLHDIEFVWTVDLPNEMNVKLIDLSIILGNALDNAIEASQKIDQSDRLIDLRLYTDMEYLVIKVRNNFDGEMINEDLSTTKDDEKNHGYGLDNIRFVTAKYDGILNIDSNGSSFMLNIALPN